MVNVRFKIRKYSISKDKIIVTFSASMFLPDFSDSIKGLPSCLTDFLKQIIMQLISGENKTMHNNKADGLHIYFSPQSMIVLFVVFFTVQPCHEKL